MACGHLRDNFVIGQPKQEFMRKALASSEASQALGSRGATGCLGSSWLLPYNAADTCASSHLSTALLVGGGYLVVLDVQIKSLPGRKER